MCYTVGVIYVAYVPLTVINKFSMCAVFYPCNYKHKKWCRDQIIAAMASAVVIFQCALPAWKQMSIAYIIISVLNSW